MKYFVSPDSIVRSIWGKSDTVLFIFAGAAAEFALNKAVDWLYFTGRLPADPIGRLFSTVGYARQIIFSEENTALAAIDRMRMIHSGVEGSRGFRIPDEAYRDVLYMLVYYSIAAFELLERPLRPEEKEEAFTVFLRVGSRMGVPGLPASYEAWLQAHEVQLKSNLERSHYTEDLYVQYRKHLGPLRYWILLKVQGLLAPPIVRNLLLLRPSRMTRLLIAIYAGARGTIAGRMAKALLVPTAYRTQVKELDVTPAQTTHPSLRTGKCPMSRFYGRRAQGA